jgi:hypothetical protein
MKVLTLTTAATDLAAQNAPFLPNYDVVALAAASVTLEHSDTAGSGYTDLVALTAGLAENVALSKQYIRVKSSGVARLIGN